MKPLILAYSFIVNVGCGAASSLFKAMFYYFVALIIKSLWLKAAHGGILLLFV